MEAVFILRIDYRRQFTDLTLLGFLLDRRIESELSNRLNWRGLICACMVSGGLNWGANNVMLLARLAAFSLCRRSGNGHADPAEEFSILLKNPTHQVRPRMHRKAWCSLDAPISFGLMPLLHRAFIRMEEIEIRVIERWGDAHCEVAPVDEALRDSEPRWQGKSSPTVEKLNPGLWELACGILHPCPETKPWVFGAEFSALLLTTAKLRYCFTGNLNLDMGNASTHGNLPDIMTGALGSWRSSNCSSPIWLNKSLLRTENMNFCEETALRDFLMLLFKISHEMFLYFDVTSPYFDAYANYTAVLKIGFLRYA
uniref:Uncharacterized protein n=1 Tax=Oryza brachyantha TaxID=4533 RepID=J3MR13_ORYBR